MNSPRSIGKKIALVCAGSSLTACVLTLGFALWSWQTHGKGVITGSLFATVFFFFSATAVLYEMSRPRQFPPPAAENAHQPD